MLRPRGRRRRHVGAEEVVHRRRLAHAGLAQQDDRRVVGAPVQGKVGTLYRVTGCRIGPDIGRLGHIIFLVFLD